MTINLLKDKRILLGVTGSIAVYKALDLASKLTQAEAVVDVIMTEAAQKFVTPLAFQAVTGRGVYTQMWQTEKTTELPSHIAHVGLGEDSDLMLIAPITANSIAKLSHGFADDLLSVVALTAKCPLMIAPAMDGGMYEHPATQANLKTLHERDVVIIEPEEGRFASGMTGVGRLPETPVLMGYIRQLLGQLSGRLRDKHIMVTAGGTREALDPVRYLTNRSSGKQGFAVAQAAIDAGAKVTLVTTTDSLEIPIGASIIRVASAEEMRSAVLAGLGDVDALVMAAAIADFRPSTVSKQKIKKLEDETEGLHLDLDRTPDVLLAVKEFREEYDRPRVVVGFAAESQDLLTNANSKLHRKGLDLIVANDITGPDAGFEVDTNRVILIGRNGEKSALDLMTKAEVGEFIMQQIAWLL